MQNIWQNRQLVVCVWFQYAYVFFILTIGLFTKCSEASVLKHRDVLERTRHVRAVPVYAIVATWTATAPRSVALVKGVSRTGLFIDIQLFHIVLCHLFWKVMSIIKLKLKAKEYKEFLLFALHKQRCFYLWHNK